MQIEAADLQQLDAVTAEIAKQLKKNRVVCFVGEMGAGKTTLIAKLCNQLGVKDNVSSPTFSLVNEYLSPSEGTIFHFDFYRIANEEEALDMGVEEYLYSPAICCIEWPEKIENLLPVHYLEVKIEQKQHNRIYKLRHV